MAPTWIRIKLCKVVLEAYASTKRILTKPHHKEESVETCAQAQPLLPVKLGDSSQTSSPSASLARYTTRINLITFHILTNSQHP